MLPSLFAVDAQWRLEVRRALNKVLSVHDVVTLIIYWVMAPIAATIIQKYVRRRLPMLAYGYCMMWGGQNFNSPFKRHSFHFRLNTLRVIPQLRYVPLVSDLSRVEELRFDYAMVNDFMRQMAGQEDIVLLEGPSWVAHIIEAVNSTSIPDFGPGAWPPAEAWYNMIAPANPPEEQDWPDDEDAYVT